MPRIVCISDTHGKHARIDLPEGDVLVHAGDCSNIGTVEEIGSFAAWMRQQPHRHKLFVPGNHDWAFSRTPDPKGPMGRGAGGPEDLERVLDLMDYAGVTVLGLPGGQYQAQVAGVSVVGLCGQRPFCGWAFDTPEPELANRWALIHEETDLLITHSPPHSVLDMNDQRWSCGSVTLRDRLEAMEEPPNLHVFGHIHESRGVHVSRTLSVNASYHPTAPFYIVDLDDLPTIVHQPASF